VLYAIEMAQTTSRKAMNNFNRDYFKIGKSLNACLIDDTAPLLSNTSKENLASTMVYASDASMQLGNIAFGKRNADVDTYQKIKEKFCNTLKELKTR